MLAQKTPTRQRAEFCPPTIATALLASWPLPRKPSWADHVNTPLTENELAAVRRSMLRGNPFGDGDWCDKTDQRLGLETTRGAKVLHLAMPRELPPAAM
jgi:hypothetical protein